MTADRLEIFRDNAGKWRFRRRARNGEIGNPSQPYTRLGPHPQPAPCEVDDVLAVDVGVPACGGDECVPRRCGGCGVGMAEHCGPMCPFAGCPSCEYAGGTTASVTYGARSETMEEPRNEAAPAGNRGLTKTTVGVEMADSQHTHIRWTCDRCRFPIEDGTGVLAVPIAEISDPPEFGMVWQAVHIACADHLHDYYGIDIEKVATHAGLIRWTAHLLGKSWITESNWDEVLRESVGG